MELSEIGLQHLVLRIGHIPVSIAVAVAVTMTISMPASHGDSERSSTLTVRRGHRRHCCKRIPSAMPRHALKGEYNHQRRRI